jgi:hypothetical protein
MDLKNIKILENVPSKFRCAKNRWKTFITGYGIPVFIAVCQHM